LQQHYTSSPASAQALTGYLQSIDAPAPSRSLPPASRSHPGQSHRTRRYVRPGWYRLVKRFIAAEPGKTASQAIADWVFSVSVRVDE